MLAALDCVSLEKNNRTGSKNIFYHFSAKRQGDHSFCFFFFIKKQHQKLLIKNSWATNLQIYVTFNKKIEVPVELTNGDTPLYQEVVNTVAIPHQVNITKGEVAHVSTYHNRG